MKRYIYFTVLGIMTIAANPFYSCDIGYDCVFKDELPDELCGRYVCRVHLF
jgi:hypothetical protein